MTRPTADSFDRLLARARDYLSTEIDARDSEELSALIDAAETRDDALTDLSSRFEGPLRFGTAGIRGLVGAGESRMNRVLVRRVSYGLATYLIATNPKALSRGIVLARDARNRSQSFQEEAAGVFAACGLPVWFLDGPQPTPLAAFAIKHVGAAAGVVITASHNPREYNGYKAYWENGAQIVPPTDALIATRFDEAPPAASIPTLAFDELGGQLRPVPDLAAAYLDALPPLQSSLTERSRLSVAYSALHGVGYEMFSRAIEKSGAALHSVEEQERPDPDFPTVTFPNPEEPGVSDKLIALAREEHADVAMINDPDADRLAIAVPSDEAPSGFRSLSGNEL